MRLTQHLTEDIFNGLTGLAIWLAAGAFLLIVVVTVVIALCT